MTVPSEQYLTVSGETVERNTQVVMTFWVKSNAIHILDLLTKLELVDIVLLDTFLPLFVLSLISEIVPIHHPSCLCMELDEPAYTSTDHIDTVRPIHAQTTHTDTVRPDHIDTVRPIHAQTTQTCSYNQQTSCLAVKPLTFISTLLYNSLSSKWNLKITSKQFKNLCIHFRIIEESFW